MGKNVLSTDAYVRVQRVATRGGTQKATLAAEIRVQSGQGLDPMVDPKGPAHLGPVRLSLPRFEQVGIFWQLTRGVPMNVETLFDTTASMGDNVDDAFRSLPLDYAMLTEGSRPILGRYDVQIATAIFNDIQDTQRDPGIAVLARTQFEMAEKIAMQMAMLPPGRNGCGNGKEDPQFGLFAAAYLTSATINRWGLKGYHFTVSDEPVDERIDERWLKKIFGDDVLNRVKENGHNLSEGLPNTAQTVRDLQARAHAFFLQVESKSDVTTQWTRLYGREHVIALPGGTKHLHYVKAVIIGLTEGVLDLETAVTFLTRHELDAQTARQIVRAVTHIPLGAQMRAENFARIPTAGDFFQQKTDLWPVDPNEVPIVQKEEDGTGLTWL